MLPSGRRWILNGLPAVSATGNNPVWMGIGVRVGEWPREGGYFPAAFCFFILSVGPKHILPCRRDFFRALFGPVWEIGGLPEKQTTQPAVGHTG